MIQINYLNDKHEILGTYLTSDEYSPGEVAAWEEWLNDGAPAPDAPEGWTQFELVDHPSPAL